MDRSEDERGLFETAHYFILAPVYLKGFPDMRRAFVLLALCTCQGGTALAQSWVEAIFPEQTHEFGTVARGSKVKHTFRLVNTTNHQIHIADWRTKCGCTDVRVGARDIPPGTQTFIEATLDTTRFLGPKNSGLTLVFDRPSFAEKDLLLTCYIRGDVLLNPGSVDFGVVTRGAPASQVLQLNYLGGQTNWGITKIETISPNITAKLDEVAGTRSSTSVQYRLSVQLNPSVQTGYLKDEITLYTNDSTAPTIPISVTGNVQGAVVVSPSVLTLGSLKPGQTITRDVLIRSAQPFTVTEASARQGELTATKGAEAPRTLHKLTVTVKAPDKLGPYYGLMELKTSLQYEPPVKLTAFATVVP